MELHPFSQLCSSARLDEFHENILIFEPYNNDWVKKSKQTFDLNQVLGVDHNGQFVWGSTNFTKRAQGNTIKLTDKRTITAKLRIGGIAGNAMYSPPVTFDLDRYLKIQDGKLVVTGLPAAVAMNAEDAFAAAAQLAAKIRSDPDLKIAKATTKDGVIWCHGSSTTAVNTSDFIVTLVSSEVKAVFLKAVEKSKNPVETLDIEVLKARGLFEIGYCGILPLPVYVNAELRLNLFVAKASIFDIEVGIVPLGGKLGYKDSSLEVELAGCGFVFGRRMGISLLGVKATIDLIRLPIDYSASDLGMAYPLENNQY